MTTTMTQAEIDALNNHPLRPYSISQITAMIRGHEVVEPADWNKEEANKRISTALFDYNDTVAEGTYDGLRDPSDPDAHPKKIVYSKSYSGLGADFNNTLMSERAVELIEKLEPGVHQFIPYDIVSRKDRSTRIDVRYKLFVRAFRSAVDLKRVKLRKRWYSDGTDIEKLNARLAARGSDNLIKLEEEDFRTLSYDWVPEDGTDIPLSLDHLEEHHLWQDKFIPAFTYISAELHARMKETKITGLYYKQWNAGHSGVPETGSFKYRPSAPVNTGAVS